MKKFAKRFTLAFLAGILMALGAVLGACGGKDPEPSEEQGLYYYDAGTEEYTLELILGNTFTLEMKGKEMTGKYELDGELLTLKVKKGDELSANYYENAVTLTYEEATYRFLKKIDYTVTFQTNGGTAVDAQKVVNGKTVAKPDDPVNGDLVFVGWYTDNNTFRNLFSFTQPITADITLYARFVEKIQPEFTVKFDAGEGATTVDPMTTVGHKLFGLPTPQKAGTKFVGWWMSDYNDAEKLTAQYVEQSIEQPITLYAVWESDAPAVSVSSTGVVWTGRSGNTNYTVTITDPDGNAVVNGLNVGTTSYAYNFANAAEGDYTVSVTMNGQTTTAYYKNKALASVSYFEVEGNTLLFNAVPNATNYLITVVCGTETHTHTDLDLGTKTSFDFSECAMKDGKIVFTVKATAEGYVPSTSRSYECTRTLDAVTGLSFDAEKDVVSWAAVKNAASYLVSVAAGSQVDSKEVLGTEFDLQYYNSGDLSVMVTPKAIGWNSPVAASGNYAKAHLATPANIRLVASTLHWEEVDGAQSYTVSINGQVRSGLTDHTLDLTEYYDPAKTSYEIKVCAIATDTANSSLWAEYTIRNGEMGAVEYERGTVKWDAVFGAQSYRVKLNDSKETTPVEDGATSYAITFTQEGENTISVCAVNADGTTSDWKTVTVTVYSIKFDAQNGENRPTLYKAKGDPLTLSETTRYGYTFSGWYTEPNGEGDPFTAETFDFEYNRTVYAKWTPNKYWVSFIVDENYGKPLNPVEVTFGEPLQLDPPELAANNVTYAFSGWYDNTNRQYTDYTGKGVGANVSYLYAGDTVLRAHWAPIFNFEKSATTNTYTVSKGEGIGFVREVTIPAVYTDGTNSGNVTVISDFSDTASLQKIYIPDSIEIVMLGLDDGVAFLNCKNLTEINIYKSGLECDQTYYSADGVLFHWNDTTNNMELVYYPCGRTATEYTIPGTIEMQDNTKASVNVIASGAFNAPSHTDRNPLQTLNIPATVSVIQTKAFYFFYEIDKINFLPLKEGETQANDLVLQENAFGDPNESLSTSRIEYIKLPNYIKTNPRDALRGLTSLTYIEVEEGGTYKSVEGLLCEETEEHGLTLVFYPRYRSVDSEGNIVKDLSGTSLKRVEKFVIPAEIRAIGEKAVEENTSLKELVVHGDVQYIGKSAFAGTTNLATITFEGDENDFPLTIDEYAFHGKRVYDSDGNGTKDMTVHNQAMTELTLPANLQTINQYAFGELNKLTTVYVTYALNDEIKYATGAFDGGESGNSFSASRVTDVTFTATVPHFEVLNVFGANLKTLNIDQDNPYYYTDTESHIVYKADMSDVVFFPPDFSGSFTFPSGANSVQTGMFKGRTGIIEVIIPANVTSIGSEAFLGCTGLQKVTFLAPEGDAEKKDLTIGASAFSGCEALDNLELPDRLVSIDTLAFQNCTGLTTIALPASLKSIGVSSVYYDIEIFNGCDNLTTITVDKDSHYFEFKDGVLYTRREAKLTSDATDTTYVPDKVIYVASGAPDELKISGYISGIGARAFGRSGWSASSLGFTKITFEDHVDTYAPETGAVQFTGIDFKPYTVPANVNMKSDYSPFYNLTDLTAIHFPTGMETMPDYLVYSCAKLATVNVPNTVTSIAPTAFNSCENITQFTFDDGGTAPLRIEDAKATTQHDGPTNYTSLFGRMKNLTTITFPARLSYLGSYAFYYVGGDHGSITSSYVQQVHFAKKPTTTLEFATNVFYQTKNLQLVELPEEGLTEIPEKAFYNSGITSITIPGCVTAIGNSAFVSSKLTAITFNEGLETIGNNAFENLKTLTGTLSIPSTVTSIGNSAFSGTGYSTITTAQDNELATIGNSTFASMTNLNTVTFGESETPLTFGASVFTGCTSLASFEFPQNVKVIGASIFANLAGLTEITFAGGTSLLESIGDAAFSKTGITEISFPASSSETGITLGANLFKSCTQFTTLNLSASIPSVSGVLNGCASIEKINIDKDNKTLQADENLPIIYELNEKGERSTIALVYGELNGESKRFQIASGTVIGRSAFANQTELEYVFIPASVTTIEPYAFQNCVNLKQVELASGSTLATIGEGAFQNCWKLETINLEDAAHLTSFGDGNYITTSNKLAYYGVFMFAGIHSENPLKIKLPASVTTLGKYMFTNSGAVEIDMSATQVTELPAGGSSSPVFYGLFSGSKKLTTIKLPSSVTFLGTSTFADCTALTRIYTGQADDKVAAGTFDLSGLTNLKYIGSTKGTAPSSSAYSIYLFARCTALTSVTFPSSVQSAGGRMFYGCSNLATINGLEDASFPAGYAYTGSGITSVTVPEKPAKYMYSDCTKLTSVTFASANTTFADYLFQNCTALQKVDLSSLTNVSAFANYMFDGCTALEEVTLPKGATLKHLGQYTFRNCSSLKKINSEEEGTVDLSGLTELARFSTSATTSVGKSTNSYLFEGCTSIKKVLLPEKFVQIGGYAFHNCIGLETIALANVTDIGQYAFAGSGLTSVTIPETTKNVYEGAFSDCASLTDVIFAENTGTNNTTVSLTAGSSSKPGAFGRSGVKNVTFSSRVTNLTTATFMNCPDLVSITLPATITTLGGYLFSGCTALESADLSALTVKSLGSNTFDGCTSLTDVKLPDTLTYLGTYTFRNCSSLETIDISKTAVERFSSSSTSLVTDTTTTYLFAGCTNLNEVETAEGQIKQIGGYTFQNCEKLKFFDLSGVERLSPYAFYNTGLTGTVTLPASLTYFYVKNDVAPFRGCGKVEAYAIEEDQDLTVHISSSATRLLTAQQGALVLMDLSDMAISVVAAPSGATFESDTVDFNKEEYKGVALTAYLFENATNIKKVILPDGLTQIPSYMFNGSNVEEIVVPASVTSIGTNAFANTPNLTTVTFLKAPEGTEEQPLTFAAGSTGASGTTGVFYASGIETVVLPDRLTDVPSGTFKDMPNLKSVTFPQSMTKINNYMFYGSAITDLQLTDNITEIGNYVYSHVNGLGDLKPEDFKNVTTIGTYAFEYTEGIKNVTFSEKILTLGDFLFNYSKVENVVFPGTMTSIGNYMFQHCDALNKVEIQDTAEGVERDLKIDGLFRNSSLQTAIIGEGVTGIGSEFFLETKITSVVLPESVVSIGNNAFRDCTELQSVQLPKGLKSIGHAAFRDCTKLTKLVIYDAIESIGGGSSTTQPGAFSGWTKDQTIYFVNSRSYISALIGMDWATNLTYQLEANVVYDYDPATEQPAPAPSTEA